LSQEKEQQKEKGEVKAAYQGMSRIYHQVVPPPLYLLERGSHDYLGPEG
jgi:hypothetical protein